jgi:hypothetical protein
VSPLRISGLAALAAAAMLGPGTRDALADEKPRETTADPDAWRFRATAYGWLMSVSGNVTAHGQTVDLDASFIQLVQKSDSLAAVMAYFEADKGPVADSIPTSFGPALASRTPWRAIATRSPA